MPRRRLDLQAADGNRLRAGFTALRADLGLPAGFPPAVLAEADAAAARGPAVTGDDATDLPFVTLDPPGAMDLDQAMHLSRRPRGGYRVRYAIADVAAWVTPGGAIDDEAHRRVETVYLPDRHIALHPPRLSEDAASLLPGAERPALLWTIDLDADGRLLSADVRRARVRSRARHAYADVQAALDRGTAGETFALLRRVGMLREELERERGGVHLPIPQQRIAGDGDGDAWRLEYRAPLPVEGWNAQISLLTGIAAADLMAACGIGVLRTLRAASAGALATLRRVAAALDVDWPDGQAYPDLVRGLDPARPRHAAFLQEATGLLRGAGYTAFAGVTPDDVGHAAVAETYAHVTAPLRRLVDRYAGETCLALAAGDDVPDWVRERLPSLPKTMEAGDRRAAEAEREAVDLTEAVVLEPHVGRRFRAVVVDLATGGGSGTVQLREPAVRARVSGPGLRLGEEITVTLSEADPDRRRVRFTTGDGGQV